MAAASPTGVFHNMSSGISMTRWFEGNHSIQDELRRITKPLRVIYISTCTPRRCGIATFTRDLTQAINLLNPSHPAERLALDNEISRKLTYPREVKQRIREQEWGDYQQAVELINAPDGPELVSLQHEFGIFGNQEGEVVIPFIRAITKPVVTTLHTIISSPTSMQREIIRQVSAHSTFVVVMLDAAARVLEQAYGVSPQRIVVIPHGVPDFPRLHTEDWKERLGLEKFVVMTSINLLSPMKGIEYAIRSLPKIVKKIPHFLYLVIGQSHPVFLKRSGGIDIYRRQLVALTKKLRLTKNLKFIKRYVSLGDLIKYIGASDYYITPYLDPQQAASGALSYAIGGGKVCISTPYLYAKEMLGRGRGMLVPFRNSRAIADAVLTLTQNTRRRRRYERRAYRIGRTMTWVNVAHQYFHLFNTAIYGP